MTKRPHLAQRPAGSLRLRVAPGAAPAWGPAPVLRACAPRCLSVLGVQWGEPVPLHDLDGLLASVYLPAGGHDKFN